MARVNVVQRAKKPQGQCGRCQADINVGDPYRWTKRRYGPRLVRCMESTCGYKPSEMTGSAHLQAIYGAQEDWSDAQGQYARNELDIGGLADELESAASVIREESESYQESADSQGEYFPGSEQVETAEANATACQEGADAADEIVEKLREVEGALSEADTILDVELQ